MRTQLLVLQNIRALLDRRGQSQRALASWAGHHETWISKILKEERGLDLADIDKIADFFGLAGYQLLTPGIGAFTERRRGERRAGRDRRGNMDRRRDNRVPPEFKSSR